MTPRVLITGGAGFIGSFVAERFLRQGHAVRLLDSLDPQVHPEGVPDYLPAEAELRIGDVRDAATVAAALEDVEVVVHCAAAVGVAQSMYRVAHYIDVNVNGTATLLQALIERRDQIAKLVVPTSMTGYGEGVYRHPRTGATVRVPIRSPEQVAAAGWEPIDADSGEPLIPVATAEEAELRAQNVYALSKRYQEELALSLGAFYGLPTTCLRLFNVFGPRQSLSNPYTGVLAIFLSRLLQGESPIVYEDGRQTRDFISVHDVARAIALAAEPGRGDGQAVNVGTGIARPIAEIAAACAALLGRDIAPHVTGQFRKGDIRHCFADTTRARTALGFEPHADWATALLETAAWATRAPRAEKSAQAAAELAAFGIVGPPS